MSKTTKTYLRIVLTLALVLGAFEYLMLRAITSPTLSERAAQWAQTLTRAERSKVETEISNYPAAYRIAFLRTSNPKERAALFESHISEYMKTQKLSEAQRVFLDRVLGALSDGRLFSSRLSAADKDWLAAGAKLFSKDIAANLFVYLGPSDRQTGITEPLLNRMAGWLARSVVVSAEEWPDCSCSTVSDFCEIGSRCYLGGHHMYVCTVVHPDEVTTGCGVFLLYDCDGDCDLIVPE